MRCSLCGRPDAEFADGHLCVAEGVAVPRTSNGTPASAWRVTSWVLLLIGLLYVLACAAKVVLLLQDYRFVDDLTRRPGAIDVAELYSLADRERFANAVIQLLVLAYLVGFLAWFWMIWRVVVRNGLRPTSVLRHWTVVAWAVSIVVSPILALLTRTPTIDGDNLAAARTDLLAFDRNQIIFTVVRMLVGALLIATVWVLRRRVRSAIFGPLEAIVAGT
jgi:flagellar biogenesis protein FliO